MSGHPRLAKFSGLVRRSFSHNFSTSAREFTQEAEYPRCGPIEFIDDCRLLFRLGQTGLWKYADVPHSLVIINTGNDTEGTPLVTIFHLHLPRGPSPGSLHLTLERAAHEPYPTESLAPFHHDPAQRILALQIQVSCRLVVRVKALLELLRDREGTEIGWDEWKHHLVLTSINVDNVEHPTTHVVQVSGCRLFCIYSTDSNRDFQMEVYDFSKEGHMKHLKEQTNGMLGTVTKYLTSNGVAAKIPRRALVNRSGDLSIALFYVCIAVPSSPLKRD